MRRMSILTLILLTCLVSAAWPQAPPGNYKFTTFDAPGAGTGANQGTFAFSINPTGLIAGEYLDANNVYHGFLRTPGDGTITKVDAPDAGTAFHQGTRDQLLHPLNAVGAIGGYYIDAQNAYHGFLRAPDPDGTIKEFDAPDAGTGAFQGTQGIGVNSAGEVTGQYLDANNVFHAFLRQRDLHGTIHEGDVPGAGTGYHQGTSADGKLGGVIKGVYIDGNSVWHSFLRMPDGTITNIDAPDAGTGANQGTLENDRNSKGGIAGTYIDANIAWHGFLRTPDPDGEIKEFDAPGAGTGSGQGTQAWGMNPTGWITGYYIDANGVSHGFLRTPRGHIYRFDAPGAGTTGNQGTYAREINPTGAIAGYYIDANRVSHGFLLSR